MEHNEHPTENDQETEKEISKDKFASNNGRTGDHLVGFYGILAAIVGAFAAFIFLQVDGCDPCPAMNPPKADIYATAIGGTSPLSITLDASDSEGNDLSYEWFKNDELFNSNKKIDYTFENNNDYRIKLIVTDNCGTEDSKVIRIKVFSPYTIITQETTRTTITEHRDRWYSCPNDEIIKGFYRIDDDTNRDDVVKGIVCSNFSDNNLCNCDFRISETEEILMNNGTRWYDCSEGYVVVGIYYNWHRDQAIIKLRCGKLEPISVENTCNIILSEHEILNMNVRETNWYSCPNGYAITGCGSPKKNPIEKAC